MRSRARRATSSLTFDLSSTSCSSIVGSGRPKRQEGKRERERRVSRRETRRREISRRKTSPNSISHLAAGKKRRRDRVSRQVVRIRSMPTARQRRTRSPHPRDREHRTHSGTHVRAHAHAYTGKRACTRYAFNAPRDARDGRTHRRGISRRTLPSRATGHIYIRADPWKRRAQPFSTLGSTYFTVT